MLLISRIKSPCVVLSFGHAGFEMAMGCWIEMFYIISMGIMWARSKETVEGTGF